MPDTIIPVVRRPTRKITPTEPKEVPSVTRKLSLGADSSKNAISSLRDRTPTSPTSSTTPSWKIAPSTTSSSTSVSTPSWKTSRASSTPQPDPEPWRSYPTYPHAHLKPLPVAKNRAVKTQRDLALEHKVLQWIMSIIHEQPATDYDRFIQDGSVLSKVMVNIVFNSVPLEQIDQQWGWNPALDRVKTVIREIRRYGVVDVFEPEDLIELKNIPKVTKCLAQLSKLAASDKDNMLASNMDLPH